MLQRFSDARGREPVLKLSLNGMPIEVPLDLLARTLREHILTGMITNRHMTGLTPKERTWRLTMKGAIDVTLALIEAEITESGADIPLPITDPRELAAMDHDILSYGMEYLWGLILSALNEAAVDATAHIEEREDGTQAIVLDEFVSRPPELAEEAGLDAVGERTDDHTRLVGAASDFGGEYRPGTTD